MSPNKLKTLHLHYNNALGQKTYQGGDIPQGAPTRKFGWKLNEVAMWQFKYIISPRAEDPWTSN